MAFYVVEVDNDGFKIYDSAGNLIDPAKDASVTALGTILTAIKDTDGIKKIIDALPTGTNEIGKVAQGTKAAGSAAWPIVLYDASGNAISILSDGGVYRIQTVGKLLNTSGAQINPATEETLALIKNTDGIKKIVDALPTGSNTIGKVDQGTGGASAWLVTGSGGGGSTQVEGRAADGASPVGNPVLVAGQDGTLVQSLLTDTQGRLIIAPPGTKATLKGFNHGKVTRAAINTFQVEWTTYTEQTSNAQRSIASSSASDAAAGTGARTVKITYYSVSAGVITGPFYETVTLNGTSYVNTVSNTIAFIEKIDVLTVGSGLTNAGILTLKAGTAGAGVTIVTIGAGEGQTFLAHHYVASGRTMYLTGVSVGLKGADAASYHVTVDSPADTTIFERQISDTIRIGTNQSTVTRNYGTPIEIPGPSHVRIYVTPDSSSNRLYFAAMDFYEE